MKIFLNVFFSHLSHDQQYSTLKTIHFTLFNLQSSIIRIESIYLNKNYSKINHYESF